MICKNCNKNFPSKIKIDGKIRNLANRSYCLECSPWGLHNTKSFNYINKSSETIRTCAVCEKPYKGKAKVCQSCMVNTRRFVLKKQCIEYKGGKCTNCGYARCDQALVFHHLNPKEKDFNISENHCVNFDSIKEELDKCILLCHNCHTEEHWNEHKEKRELIITRYNQYRIDNELPLLGKKPILDKNYCICGKEISRKGKFCHDCIDRTIIDWPSKDELIKLLQLNSLVSIGKQLGVSDNAVKKHCKKLGIYNTNK